MNIIRLWCAALGMALLSGCAVGLNVKIGNKQFDGGKSINWSAVGVNMKVDTLRTRAEVQQHWGKPNRRFVRRGQEHWVYRSGLLWWGVDVFVFLPVPVPLRVPVCRRKTRLVFENDTLRRYTITNLRENFFGYFCGDNACRGFCGGEAKL